MKKFCPKCGETITKGTFCEECDPEVLEFKPIKVKLCPSKKYFFRGKWTKFNDLKKVTKTSIEKTLNKKIKVKEGLESYPDLLNKTGIKKEYPVIIEIKNKEYEIPINVEVTTSPGYNKVGTDYFEGILQLRNADTNIKKFTNKIIDNMKDTYVNKVTEKENSADYYFVKKKMIGRVAERISEEYGAYVDYNAQLFTQDKQTSKELFRLNVAVHIPPFKEGDVIEKKEEILLIKNTGKNNSALELEKNKKKIIKYKPEEKHEYKQIKKQKTKIINTHPLTALSNETYEVVELENPLNLKPEKNQNATITEWKGRAYLIKI